MVVVLCNCSAVESRPIAKALVTESLAACVNILSGVTSIYRWEGDLHEDTEHTLLIKTSSERVSEMTERIRNLHSYDTPEILVLPVDEESSDQAYVSWVKMACALRR